MSVGNGYQLCPMQPSHGCPRENPSHQLQGQRNLPIVQQGAMMTLLDFLQQAVDKSEIGPILRRQGTHDLLQ